MDCATFHIKRTIFFSLSLSVFLFLACNQKQEPKAEDQIMTINDLIPADSLGTCLIHEHVFLDWSGADSIQPGEWDSEAAFNIILPHLKMMKANGVTSFMECTPDYLGRHPKLLKKLAAATGLQIITNTGYYGARDNQHLPQEAFSLTAEQLAERWITEWKEGIDGTQVFPGFIKIGINSDSVLSNMHRKLVEAAALAHLQTGLTIVAHTGPDAPAREEVKILAATGVAPDALVWTHAQQGTQEGHIEMAQQGTWISLDGMGWIAPEDHKGDSTALLKYVDQLINLKNHSLLHRVLISHDAGWYTHGAEEQNYKPYTNIFKLVIPILIERGFTEQDIQQLLVKNPKEAYKIQVRRL